MPQLQICSTSNLSNSVLTARIDHYTTNENEIPAAPTSIKSYQSRKSMMYSPDYWVKKVDTMMKDKKSILDMVKKTNREIRQANEDNMKLKKALKD